MKKYVILGIIGIIIVAFAISVIFFSEIPPPQPMAKPPDFQSSIFSTNAKLIAQEISLYNQTEIGDYPLSDLPAEEIKAVFTLLNLGNLSKVLLNISQENIKKIKDKLSDEEFANILNRLPNETGSIIKEYIKK